MRPLLLSLFLFLIFFSFPSLLSSTLSSTLTSVLNRAHQHSSSSSSSLPYPPLPQSSSSASSSPPSSRHIVPCPYEVQDGRQASRAKYVLNMTTTGGFGRTGNMIKCAMMVIDYGIRCGGFVEVPPILMDAPIGKKKRYFDFSEVRRTIGKQWDWGTGCHSKTGNCRQFWKYARPKPNTAKAGSVLQDKQVQKIWSNAFMNYLNFDFKTCPNLENDLIIHVRNGDVYTSFPQALHLAHGYGQQPFCTVLSAIFHRTWDRILVISEHQNPSNPKSGPVIALLAHLAQASPSLSIHFLPGTFNQHLFLRLCAVNLVVPHSTINYLNPFLPLLQRIFDPEMEVCPPYPFGYGWMDGRGGLSSSFSPPTIFTMKKKPIDWLDNWNNSDANLLKIATAHCPPYYSCDYSLDDLNN